MNLIAVDGRGDVLSSPDRMDPAADVGEIAIVADGHPLRFADTVRTLLGAGAVPLLLPPATPRTRIDTLAERIGASLILTGSSDGSCESLRVEGRRFETSEPTYLAATSGTTGTEPSIYAFSLARARANAGAHLRSLGIGAQRGRRILLPLPLAHSFGFVCGLLAAESIDADLIATTEHPMPSVLLELVRAHAATSLHTTPTAIRAFARTRDARFAESLEVLSIGSAPATERDASLLERLAPDARRYATYGLTEAGPRVATMALPAGFGAATSAGPLPLGAPIDGVSLRFTADADGAELEVRSPYLATHRFRGSDFEAIPPDAWWPSADRVARRDGATYVLGRADGVVLRGGTNLYPATIEAVFERIARVRGVCLIRRASPVYGEVPVLVVEADASDSLRAELETVSELELMPIERPVEVIFVDALARTELGKVKRGLVQSEYGDR